MSVYVDDIEMQAARYEPPMDPPDDDYDTTDAWDIGMYRWERDALRDVECSEAQWRMEEYLTCPRSIAQRDAERERYMARLEWPIDMCRAPDPMTLSEQLFHTFFDAGRPELHAELHRDIHLERLANSDEVDPPIDTRWWMDDALTADEEAQLERYAA